MNKTFDLADSIESNNIIFGKNIRISRDRKITKRNGHVCIIGTDDTDINESYVVPNVLQANNNYVITDFDGKIYAETGEYLKQKGYDVKIINLNKNFYYNPFDYAEDLYDIGSIVRRIIEDKTYKYGKMYDPFWEKTEDGLLGILCFYLWLHRPKEEHDFENVMKLLDIMGRNLDKNDPNIKTGLEPIIKNLSTSMAPTSDIFRMYQMIQGFSPKIIKSLIIGCMVKIDSLGLAKKSDVSFDLNCVNNEKTAIFIIPSKSKENPIISLLYLQLFKNTSVPTKFIVGKIDEEKHLSDIFPIPFSSLSQRNISCDLILNNINQLKTIQPSVWDSILSDFDYLLLLDNRDKENIDYVIDRCKGKEEKNREKISEEISNLYPEKCLIDIRGNECLVDEKYRKN